MNLNNRRHKQDEKEDRKNEAIKPNDKISNSNHILRETKQTEINCQPKKSRTNSRLNSGQQHQSTSRSRSRSPINIGINKSWKSINPFINFMQDFRKMQTQIGQKSTNVFRLGGEHWQQMSQEEKQPYIDAANIAKQQKQQYGDNQQRKKSDSSIVPEKTDATRKKRSRKGYKVQSI